ncbi:MAG: ABC transporter ATP-binding protein [Oscillospiraceae bacterium]|nr:ABC transporter ATP-binding protein [Oscillospiraceae bacterium]
MAPIMKVEHVSKTFGTGEAETKVLTDVSLEIEKGEFASLMGESGSGKSTLLYLIGGLDTQYEGNIYIDGTLMTGMKEAEMSALRLAKIGFVFQFYNLIQNLSVEDNILLPIKMAGKNVPGYREKLEEILDITGLTAKRKSKPSQLSGGQQQRVSIARAVLSEPDILLADEPTGNLDTKSTAEIMELFKRINEEKKMTLLQGTHSPDTATYGGRIIRLDSGKLVG